MAVVSNKYTQQTPKASNSTKLLLAQRVYIAPENTDYTDPTAKLSGTSEPASPWVDLGIVEGSKATITYNKDIAYIETGVDRIRRGAYLRGKNASVKFQLTQFDMDVVAAVTGLTPKVVGSPAIGKKIMIGQEDVVVKSLLLVGSNKLDGKEHHTFMKNAAVSMGFAEVEDYTVLDMTAEMAAFTPNGETVDALYVLYILT